MPKHDPDRDPDERVKLPLNPEDALRALLEVDPHDEASERDESPSDD